MNKNRIATRSTGGGSSFATSSFVRKARLVALAGLSVLGVGAYSNASAQVVTPPPATHEITVFPMRDFIGVGGYVPDSDVLVQVRRGNSVVGRATGRTAAPFPELQDPGGHIEVNHPGGVCWEGVTPDLTAYDILQVTYDNTPHNVSKGVPIGSGYATRTAGISVTAATQEGNNIVIRGKALQGITQVPLNRLEVRIIQPAFRDTVGSRITKRDIRADSTGGRVDGIPGTSGTLTYDASTPACRVGCFTAVFVGLNDIEKQLALGGQTRVLSWQVTDTANNRLGMTIYEAGEEGGPGMGGCPDGPNGGIGPNPPAYPVAYNPLNLIDAANPTDPSAVHGVVVFPSRDFISAAGFPVGIELQFVVRRQDPNNPNNPTGVIAGTARGTTVTTDEGGMAEVNHPGGVCWAGQTPDIRAGDKVDIFRIVNGAFAGGETQEVIGATVSGAPFVDSQNRIIINGTMPVGWDLTRLEQRIIQPAFRDATGSRIGRRDIRADTLGGRVDGINGATGFLTQTSPTTWQVVYTGLNQIERTLALAGEIRIMAWQSVAPPPPGEDEGERLGLTIFEYNLIGGPGMGGCPKTGEFTVPVPLP